MATIPILLAGTDDSPFALGSKPVGFLDHLDDGLHEQFTRRHQSPRRASPHPLYHLPIASFIAATILVVGSLYRPVAPERSHRVIAKSRIAGYGL